MMQQVQRDRPRTKALGLLLAAIMAALLLAAKPAQAATTFTVNSTGDRKDLNAGNGSCSTGAFVRGTSGEFEAECTVRAAIQEANASSGADTIHFSIAGSGVKTISPNSELPAITDQVTIDGYTQGDATQNTQAVGTDAVLRIELDGSDTGSGNGLTIVNTSNSVIKGLVINRFPARGIEIFGEATNNRIEGNFIGTDPGGTLDRGNRLTGVQTTGVDAEDNVIGGTTLEARNLISGNNREGILIGSSGNKVQNNLVGTRKDGNTALGNSEEGIQVVNGIGNSILSNSIFDNGKLGIDLVGGEQDANGVTANDRKDRDRGANNLQNSPVITSATTSEEGLTIEGKLNSNPRQSFTIQLFRTTRDEGKIFVGELTGVKTNRKGKASFTFNDPNAGFIFFDRDVTATATNEATGDTSEFSAPLTLVSVGGD